MEIRDILKLPDNQLKPHIHRLADVYRAEMGAKVCFSCPGDIKWMIIRLRKKYMNSGFELKEASAIYRVSKQTSKTISNNVMTDDLAIEFLRVRPGRIELFSKYPDNWKELVGDEYLLGSEVEPDNKKEELLKLKFAELTEMFPNVKRRPTMSKIAFIEEVLKDN